MTGYAALDAPGRRWEARAVNGRGADIRLRLPPAADGLDGAVRGVFARVVTRGTVTVSLRSEEGEGHRTGRVDPAALAAALDAMAHVESEAGAVGVALAPATPADVLRLPGVWRSAAPEGDADADALLAEAARLAEAFDADRAREGAALRGVVAGHLDAIADGAARAADMGGAVSDHAAAGLRAALDRLRAAGGGAVEDGRVAQEAALLAVRADVAEEVDRLGAHVAAARDLLDADAPGRRLGFLAQEMGREANTLGSKAQLPDLSDVALDLKVAVDRLREQVANVE